MDIAVTIALVVMGAAAAAVFDRRRHGLLGFQAEPGGTAQRLTGLLARWTGRPARVYPYAVGRMDTTSLSEAESGLRFAVEGLCPSVTLWRIGFSSPTRVDATQARPVGEPEIDKLFRVVGPPAHVHALLIATTRIALRELLRGSVRLGQVWLEGGTLTVDVPTSGFAREHPGLEPATHAIAGMAKLLEAPSDLVERLAENVARDPAPGVRLASLRALFDAFASHARTRTAAFAALRDGDELVRLEAAVQTKAQGRETLVRLAVDTDTSEASASRAIRALGPEHLPLDRVEPLVHESGYIHPARKARPAVTDAFIAVLAAMPGEAALDLLARLARGVHDGHGPQVVEAVAARPGLEAERLLLEAVESPRSDRPLTLTAAARHLERTGSVAAVAPLQQAAARYGGSSANAARRAIAAIQERAKGSRGRLALTDAEAGRLSEVSDPSGRVSLPDADD